jgi:hypothetical protein
MICRLMRSVALLAALCGGAVLLDATASSAMAAGEQTVSSKVGVPLKAAQDLAKQKRYKEALDKVAEAEAVSGKTAFEVLTIQKFKLYLYNQLKDYANAARAVEAVVATGQLSAEEIKTYKRQLALLYFAANATSKGVAAAKAYMAQYGNDDQLQLLIADQAYKAKDYANAAEAAEKIVRSAEANGKRPDEAALKIWAASEFFLRDGNQKAADAYTAALEKLVTYYPKLDYWRDLLINVERRPGFSQRLKLDLYLLKFTVGTLKKSDDYVEMAELGLVQNLPAYSQRVLEAGFKAKVVDDGVAGRNKRLLATATDRANKEKTTPADESSARGQATGEPLARLGDVAASYGDYARAAQFYKDAIAKGGLANLDFVRLRLGSAQIRGAMSKAGQDTMRLVKAKDGSADIAKYWSLYARQS